MEREDVFALLQSYVFESRSLRLAHIPDWNGDLRAADLGLRADFGGAGRYDALRKQLRGLARDKVISLRDGTLLRTAFFRDDTERGFYVIGPYRSAPFREADYEIIRRFCGGISDVHFVKSLLNTVPVNITELEVLTLAKHILQAFHGITQPAVVKVDLSEAEAPLRHDLIRVTADDAIRRVEETYRHEDLLMAAVTSGDYDGALKEARYFCTTPPVVKYASDERLRSIRNMLFAANTACRLAARKTGIHPVTLDDISQKHNRIIDTALTEEQLIQAYTEMLHEYCTLCREQPPGDLSPTVQKIVHYIGLHLSGDLSLTTLSEAANVSVPYINRKFREELGTTPVAYITALRIKTAARLLRESTMPVRDVAQYVGIGDWNYFAKLFKKEMGVTPSAYRDAGNAKSAGEG